MRYDKVYNFSSLNENAIKSINTYSKNNPGKRVLIQIPNTRGISSWLINKLDRRVDIRIAGGYTADRVSRRKNCQFDNGETGEYYITAVIYSKDEVVRMLKEIEKIEELIGMKWSSLQKTVFIYDKLKKSIKYDPEYEKESSRNVRSLRGLISKKTVCAGYAMIFKELLERQGIICDYVEGNVPRTSNTAGGGHAWNLVHLEGKIYPFDLTWDSSAYRAGANNTLGHFAQADSDFISKHVPFSYEPIQNYRRVLSTLSSDDIKKILRNLNVKEEYNLSTFTAHRRDGSNFLISYIGSQEVNGHMYYRYVYCEFVDVGYPPKRKYSTPLVLVSSANVSALVNKKEWKKSIPNGFESALCDELFSKRNIEDSLRRGSIFIGSLRTDFNGIWYLNKDINLMRRFSNKTKSFIRSDGSKFVVHELRFEESANPNLKKIKKYDIFEITYDSLNPLKSIVKRYVVFTEQDLLSENRQVVVDQLLSSSRLDNKVKTSGGYIGYFDASGRAKYSNSLSEHFKNNKYIGISNVNSNSRK